MQKRYCSCGHVIYVEYQFFGSMCSTRFRAMEGESQAGPEAGDVLECPHCRSLLTINTLY